MSTRLETRRLVIRTFAPSDCEDWVAMVTDPEVRRFLPSAPPPTMETFRTALEIRHVQEREIGYSMWAVEDKASGAFVGQCGIRPVDEGAGPEVDLAFHFKPSTWTTGYGTEAAIAVLAHGLGSIGLERIMAVVVPENVGSWRVMEKAGMRYVGLVDYYGLSGVRKYEAEREWWAPQRA